MQRSSESIAKLAAALAKAQIELVNPEKLQVGTIYPEGASQESRTFNYASLASGLDIVRKTLGQHEIAIVQTTAIDEATQIITLTTVLAHSSGEWISSDWPVCAISETVAPHRMGAALTYARRYALFALVGIAGEDDLDAPDQVTAARHGSDSQTPNPTRNPELNGGHRDPARRLPRRGKNAPKTHTPSLAPKASAELRDRLLIQMKEIACTDDAALWAYCNLKTKSGLIPTDAARVEDAFRVILANLDQPPEDPAQPLRSHETEPSRYNRRRRFTAIDKSVLAFPESRRDRDRDHLKYVAQQACLVCGRTPSDAHHLRFTQSPALGRKVSDEFTVPLCRGHHREIHRYGDEAAWWSNARIDPAPAARALWLKTHPLPASSDKNATAMEGGTSVVPVTANQ